MSEQTVQTQNRLLLEEQSDQGLHCLLFHLHIFNKIPHVWAFCLKLRRNIAATSLKIVCKNLYSVKSYDNSNMEVFALSLWENFSWA